MTMAASYRERPISNKALWTGRLLSGLAIAALTLDSVMKLIRAPEAIQGTLELGYPEHAVARHVRVDNPLFSHVLSGVYVAIFVWGGLHLREPRLRALLPLR